MNGQPHRAYPSAYETRESQACGGTPSVRSSVFRRDLRPEALRGVRSVPPALLDRSDERRGGTGVALFVASGAAACLQGVCRHLCLRHRRQILAGATEAGSQAIEPLSRLVVHADDAMQSAVAPYLALATECGSAGKQESPLSGGFVRLRGKDSNLDYLIQRRAAARARDNGLLGRMATRKSSLADGLARDMDAVCLQGIPLG